MLNKFDNPVERCNLKFAGGEEGVFEGYASTFDNVDSFGDTILKGAFTDTLKDRNRPVKMFLGHNPSMAIGIWPELKEDDTGLFVKGELTPGHTIARNVFASLKQGSIDGLSIGFRIPLGGAEESDDGGRLLGKIDLVEISVVSMPAEDTARISAVKSIADEISTIKSLKDVELFLREAGCFPRSMAKAFISHCRPLYQREVDMERERKEAMKRDFDWLQKITS